MLASRPWLVQPPEIPQNEQLHLFRGRPKLRFCVGLIAPTGGGLACGRSKRSIQVPKLTHQYMSKKCTSLPSIPESRGWVNKLLRRSCVPPFCDAGNRGGGGGGQRESLGKRSNGSHDLQLGRRWGTVDVGYTTAAGGVRLQGIESIDF